MYVPAIVCGASVKFLSVTQPAAPGPISTMSKTLPGWPVAADSPGAADPPGGLEPFAPPEDAGVGDAVDPHAPTTRATNRTRAAVAMRTWIPFAALVTAILPRDPPA